LAYVSRWLGHSSELTTRKHYAKWIDADPWSEFVLRDVPRQPPTDVLLDALEAEGGP
jgi:integrase